MPGDWTHDENYFVVIGQDPPKGQSLRWETLEYGNGTIKKSHKTKKDQFYFPSELDEISVSRKAIKVLPEPNTQIIKPRQRYNLGFRFTGLKRLNTL